MIRSGGEKFSWKEEEKEKRILQDGINGRKNEEAIHSSRL